MPAATRWSSSASPIVVSVRHRREPVEHRVEVGAVAAQIGAEAVERLGCAGRRTGAHLRGAARRPARRSTPQWCRRRPRGRRAPGVAARRQRARAAVHVPDAVQHHVRVQRRAVVEVHEQVLAARFDLGHVRARRRRPEASACRDGSRRAVNAWPHDAVRSRSAHRWTVSPSGIGLPNRAGSRAEGQTLVAVGEARVAQRLRARRRAGRFVVDAFELEPADATLLVGLDERVRPARAGRRRRTSAGSCRRARGTPRARRRRARRARRRRAPDGRRVSGHAIAAPYGWAGSVAASTIAARLVGVRRAVRSAPGRPRPAARTARRRARRRTSRAGRGPLPPARAAPGTPRRSRRGRLRRARLHASRRRAVRAVAAPARARSRSASARVRAAARRATTGPRPRAARGVTAAARLRLGARRAPLGRAARHAQRPERVVGDLARPHEIPQRGRARTGCSSAVPAARRRGRARTTRRRAASWARERVVHAARRAGRPRPGCGASRRMRSRK